MPRRPARDACSWRRTRRVQGNVALITAITLVMLCGFAAIAVDVGNMYRVRSQARAALDAAALAGAGTLNGMTSGLALARTRAIEQGRLHRVHQTNLELLPSQIELGNWTAASGFQPAPSIDATNAVRIVHTTEPVTHLFGAVLGARSSTIGARAIAIGGGPMSTRCAFPLVVPDCAMNVATQGNLCSYCMQMQDANSDTAGWTAFGDDPVSPPNIRRAVAAACSTISSDGRCGPDCTNPLSQNASINLGNGNMMNTGPNNFCPLIQDILQRNGAPEPFRVTVPVIRTDPNATGCNPSFSGTGQVAGFAELTIFGASCGNNDTPVIAENPTPSLPCSPPSGNYLLATLQCGTRINAPAGDGAFWGVAGRPRLVE